jgi:hypothetical protein
MEFAVDRCNKDDIEEVIVFGGEVRSRSSRPGRGSERRLNEG